MEIPNDKIGLARFIRDSNVIEMASANVIFAAMRLARLVLAETQQLTPQAWKIRQEIEGQRFDASVQARLDPQRSRPAPKDGDRRTRRYIDEDGVRFTIPEIRSGGRWYPLAVGFLSNSEIEQ